MEIPEGVESVEPFVGNGDLLNFGDMKNYNRKI